MTKVMTNNEMVQMVGYDYMVDVANRAVYRNDGRPIKMVTNYCGSHYQLTRQDGKRKCIGANRVIHQRIVGAVRHTQHITVGGYHRANVALTEFQHNIRFYFLQRLCHFRHKLLYRIRQYRNIHIGMIRSVVRMISPFINKIQFESIQIPFQQCFFIDSEQEFPYFFVSRIQNSCFMSFISAKKHTFIFCKMS